MLDLNICPCSREDEHKRQCATALPTPSKTEMAAGLKVSNGETSLGIRRCHRQPTQRRNLTLLLTEEHALHGVERAQALKVSVRQHGHRRGRHPHAVHVAEADVAVVVRDRLGVRT